MTGMRTIGLGFVLSLRDFVSSRLRNLGKEFNKFDAIVTGSANTMTAAFTQVGIGLAAFAAGAAVLGSGLALARAAGKFEQGLAAVGAVSRATAADLQGLHAAAINAGIATQFSPTEAVEGLKSLATAGQTAKQSTETLIPVLDLAAGSLGQLGVAQAADAVVGTLNAYGLAAKNATNVTDKLLRVTQLSNFQARDFEIGLSKAAATGATFGQELNDVLITMGLLRNRNIDASSSATAFREAVRRLGSDQRAQQAITSSGVDIYDKTSGKMRSIIDVIGDFAEATESMTDAERNRRVAQAFGARGLLAFNAVQKATFTIMRNGTEVILEGVEAVKAMRGEMDDAAGTAEKFRDAMLDTFEGQKTLLAGTIQTWAVALGEPFARVFKPIVKVIVGFFNIILRAFQAIPDPIKTAVAGMVTAIGAIIALAGVGLAAKGAVALLGMGLKYLGITAAGLAAAFWPIAVVLGAIAAAFVTLKFAYQHNLGGLADFINGIKTKIELFHRAIGQLFSHGGFSGAVRDELARAENSGLRMFVVNVWRMAKRLQKAWSAFKNGFVEAFSHFKPVFDDFGSSLKEIVGQVMGLFGDITEGASGLPFDTLRDFAGYLGTFIGDKLGYVLSFATGVITRFVRLYSGVVKGFRSMWQFIGPAFGHVATAIGELFNAFGELLGLGDKTNDSLTGSTEIWRSFGEVLGKLLGGVVTFISYLVLGLINFVNIVVKAVTSLKNTLLNIGRAIVRFVSDYVVGPFERAKNLVKSAIASIMHGVASFLNYFPGFILPENVLRFRAEMTRAESTGSPALSSIKSLVTSPAAAMPAAIEAQSKSAEFVGVERSVNRLAEALANRKDEQNITAVLQLDSETLGRAQLKAGQEAATRSLSSLPEYG